MSKYFYIHSYIIGSGNNQKLKQSLYPESWVERAREQHKLLGGCLSLVEVLNTVGKL